MGNFGRFRPFKQYIDNDNDNDSKNSYHHSCGYEYLRQELNTNTPHYQCLLCNKNFANPFYPTSYTHSCGRTYLFKELEELYNNPPIHRCLRCNKDFENPFHTKYYRHSCGREYSCKDLDNTLSHCCLRCNTYFKNPFYTEPPPKTTVLNKIKKCLYKNYLECRDFEEACTLNSIKALENRRGLW